MIDLDYQGLKQQNESFIGSPRFEKRKAQLRFAQIARHVLVSLVMKEKISNRDLTALINMFAFGAKEETFSRHLHALGFPDELEKSIYEEYRETGETGFTGVGLAAIKDLDENQLRAVHALLKAVSEADSVEKVKQAVDAYEQQNVPKVTRGIYSPWLYYLQPGICPLLTGKVMNFFSERGLEGRLRYGEVVDLFGNIKAAVGEDDLGLIDTFIREVAGKPEKGTGTDAPSQNLTCALAEIKRQIILYGPPGTGKTYLTKRLAVEIIRSDLEAREDELRDYPDAGQEEGARSEFSDRLAEFVEALGGTTKKPQKSMVGYYSVSKRSQKNIGLTWIGRTTLSTSAIRVHVRKPASGNYPSEITRLLSHYKENGWGGYPEFTVENDRDLENAENMIKYAYEHY